MGFFRHQSFPSWVVCGDHALDVSRGVTEELFIEERDVHDELVSQEMLVESLVLFRCAESASGDELARFSIEPRGDVESCFILERAAEGLEDAPRDIAGPLLLEELIQEADGERDGDGFARVATEEFGETIKASESGDEDRFAESLQAVRTVKEVEVIDIAPTEEVVHRDFTDVDAVSARFFVDLREESFADAVHDLHVETADRVKAPTHDDDGALIEDIGGLSDFAVGEEHGGFREAGLHQLESEEAVIDHGEAVAFKAENIDFHASGVNVVHERLDEFDEAVSLMIDSVQDVDAQDTQIPHLGVVRGFIEDDVDDEVRGGRTRAELEADADPAVPATVVAVAFNLDGITESEEAGIAALLLAEAVDELIVLVVEHAFEAFLRDVAFDRAVERIADGHVIGRDGFGDSASGSRGTEEPVSSFLASTDFCEGAVDAFLQVDLESFFLSQSKSFCTH